MRVGLSLGYGIVIYGGMSGVFVGGWDRRFRGGFGAFSREIGSRMSDWVWELLVLDFFGGMTVFFLIGMRG